jgi:tetratricopeptide (TPR) repeat protein
MSLDRPDLASAALDGIGYYHLIRGHAGRVSDVTRRRLDLVPRLADPREVEDCFAMAALAAFHVGRYRDALRHANTGFERSLPITAALGLHCLEWRALARFRLGDWPGVFRDMKLADDLVGERADAPPGFISRPFAVAALIYEIQGKQAEADRLLARLRSFEEWQEAGTFDAWLGLLLARRGRFEEASTRLERPEFAYLHDNLGLILEARCDAVAEVERWDLAGETVRLARGHAERAKLEALDLHASRLEGRALVASGQLERGTERLGAAAEGFTALGARWEAACTDLSLGRACRTLGDEAGARARLLSAVPVFEDLGAARELASARSLLTDLP